MGGSGNRPTWSVLAALALSLVVLAAVITDGWLYTRNSLYTGGRWFPTKARILHLPDSALPFWILGQTVAQNRLDLSTWLGFQEVVHLPSLRVREVQFSLRLASGSWVAFVHGDPASGRRGGVRLSTIEGLPQIAFAAEESGRFTAQRTWREAPLEADRWYRARLVFGARRLSISLDGHDPVTVPRQTGAALRLGFRGGARPALIDDVTIHHGDGQTIHDDFSNRRWALPLFLAVLALCALLSYGLRLRRVPPRRAALAATALHFILALGLGALYGGQYWIRSHRYPTESRTITGTLEQGIGHGRLPTALRRHLQFILTRLVYSDDPNLDVNGPDPEYFKEKLRRRYPVKPPAGVRRVLFVGTSQTQGDGVSVERKTFVALTQRLLNRRRPAGSAPFECINAGMPNIGAGGTAEYYAKELVRLGPDLAIINLGSNDADDPQGFSREMIRVAEASEARKVRTAFALEANAVDCSGPGDLPTHKVSRRLAAEYGFGVIELHGYLAGRARSGFQWWDCVHLSEHGQQQAAELFARRILEEFGHPHTRTARPAVSSGAEPGGGATCDELRPLSRCHGYSVAAMEVMGRDFHQGACHLTNGAWGGQGACPKSDRVGTCDDGVGTVTHYYSAGKAPYTAATARQDCKVFGDYR